jgi:uncharacterized protein (TIGR03083 family)
MQRLAGWTHTAYCDALEAEVDRVVRTVEGSDFATPVPTCPGWTIAKLIRHLGAAHRWAEAMVRDGATHPVDPRSLTLDLPEDSAGLPGWLAAGAEMLLESLRAIDPDRPMWAWGADKRGRFWSRRMLYETIMHRCDAELALGRQPEIAPETASDGIDEFLINLPHIALVRPDIADLRGTGESLHVHCTDVDGEWLIQLNPDGLTCEYRHAKATTAVRGRAIDLLLVLYRRVPPDDRVEVLGDEKLFTFWLDHSAL